MDKYIVDKDIVYELYKDHLFTGYVQTNPKVPHMEPWLAYIGPKISMASWKEILAFFIWSYKDSKSETQVRLYLNQSTGIWRAWAFPQERGTGMSTRELEKEGEEESQRVGLAKGWVQGGTVHHHCSAHAFQSGTDHADEKTKNGIHLTVGSLDKSDLSIHARQAFRHVFYEPYLPNWFEMPEGLSGLPDSFRAKVMEYFLTRRPLEDHAFPEEWKQNVIQKSTGYSPGMPYLGYSSANWHKHPRTGEWVNYPPSWLAKNGKLSRKERKRLAKEAKEAAAKEPVVWTQSYMDKVATVAGEIELLCKDNNLTMDQLDSLTYLHEVSLTDDDKAILTELERILDSAKVTMDDVVDWEYLEKEAAREEMEEMKKELKKS